ncbi:sensor histidine kinase [Filimonas effusa]|uniref:Histidine kinase n=1 Tax=Filimonas effusa TaxID=2508721 RepID=A0A4Q1DB82_9BACT|nr:histidine kinase [Filimonas effusa]RXK86701.1 histidine kinase [Filimonas effusa]
MKVSYHSKWITFLLHVTVWIVIFSLPYLLRHSYENSGVGRFHSPPPLNAASILINLTWVGLFYLNSELWVPWFINRRKYLYYGISQLIAFLAVMGIHWLIFTYIIPADAHKPNFRAVVFIDFNLALFLLVVAASTAYRLISEKIRLENLEKEKQKENMKTELSFLRSQISPHFMFNVLNNIVALARLKSDKLEPTIFKLSSLMRYMLYESDERRVPLGKEIEYLKSYIDLQQLRFGQKVTIYQEISITDELAEIEPMLLIPFVENAFKHGTGYIQQPRIEIILAQKADLLTFTVRNKFSEAVDEPKDHTSGIGLANVERRLTLLYPKAHKLHITRAEGWFTIILQLKLHDVTMHSY